MDFAMRNYKDESFIGQFLSPRLMREFHLFAIADHEKEDHLSVDVIHDEAGYRRLRRLFAGQYNRDCWYPISR
jgi:spore cortex formation protein SpoVR/YcgB (stage V sporulation)